MCTTGILHIPARSQHLLQSQHEKRGTALSSYRILTHESSELRVVKIGFSWPAFLLSLIWLVANGLWLGAILVSVMIFGMLALFGSAVQESPVVVSLILFAGELALLLFLGSRGNDWLASQLESRGYTHALTVEAESFTEAWERAATDHSAE